MVGRRRRIRGRFVRTRRGGLVLPTQSGPPQLVPYCQIGTAAIGTIAIRIAATRNLTTRTAATRTGHN